MDRLSREFEPLQPVGADRGIVGARLMRDLSPDLVCPKS